MIVLVPISPFRVTYDVALGRPYSRLECLVLKAVAGGATNVDQLERIFCVHRRLLVESLVTLTQAGWIAIGPSSDSAFLLTSEGNEAVNRDESPRSRVVENRAVPVILERLTGACISNGAFRYWSNREIAERSEKAVRLQCRIGKNYLDDAEVVDLLPRRQGEWIHWVGPIDLDSKLNHWLPLSVDLTSNKVVGLPDEWQHRLTDIVLEEARRLSPTLGVLERKATLEHAERPLAREDADLPKVPDGVFDTTLVDKDFLYTQKEHIEVLRTALGEAKTSLLVMSAFLNLQSVQQLMGDLLRALQRGVNIDLMWGYATNLSDASQDATKWLRDLASSTKSSGLRGGLRLNEVGSQSHAKLLVWDGEQGFETCLGSFNWLSSIAGDDAVGADSIRNLSVRISERSIVSRICRRAAVLLDAVRSEATSSTGDRWRQVATELEASTMSRESGKTSVPNAKVSIVADRDHEYLLRRELIASRSRVIITSHKLGPIAETRLMSALERERDAGFALTVLYGEATIDPDAVGRFAEVVTKAGGIVKSVPRLHAKILVSDNALCVSSYNFLSADAYSTATESRELGIRIVGSEPADSVAKRLATL